MRAYLRELLDTASEAGFDMSKGSGDQVGGPRIEVGFGRDGLGRVGQELVGCGGDRAGRAGSKYGLVGAAWARTVAPSRSGPTEPQWAPSPEG